MNLEVYRHASVTHCAYRCAKRGIRVTYALNMCFVSAVAGLDHLLKWLWLAGGSHLMRDVSNTAASRCVRHLLDLLLV